MFLHCRQGYLFVQGKKNLKLGSVWTKYFCQYQAKTKTLTLIPYSQLTGKMSHVTYHDFLTMCAPGKITGGESVRVTGCLCHDETSDKFRFSVTGADLSTGTGNGITGGSGGEMVTYNIQVRTWHLHWTELIF